MAKKLLKKMVLLSSATLASSLVAQSAAAMGGGGCVSGNIQISTILTPLNFASLSACGGASGTLTVSPQGNLSTGGCINGTSGIVQIGKIRVQGGQGNNGIKVVIQVPASAAIAAGANNMNVNAFLFRKGGGGTPTVTIGGAKTETLDIGATLNVSAGQASGTYTGAGTFSAVCQ